MIPTIQQRQQPQNHAQRYQAQVNRMHLMREVVEVLLLVGLIYFAIHVSIDTRTVYETSMLPNYHPNDRVIVNKFAYTFGTPQRGDVITFYYPYDTSEVFIKRIIGVPGDTVVVTPKTVSINGHILNEPFVSQENSSYVGTWVLGVGQYFVMGDNRPVSLDSRKWGVLDKKFIIGKVVYEYWPLNHAHTINTYSGVFNGIPIVQPKSTAPQPTAVPKVTGTPAATATP